MTFCTGCGAQIPTGSHFCGGCGQPVNAPGRAQAARAVPGAEQIKPRIRTRVPSFVKKQIRPSEQMLGAFSVSLFDHHRKHDLRHDRVLLTTERIIYYRTAFIHKAMGEIPYRMVTGVSYNRGLMHGKVIVDAANAGLTLRGIGNDDAAFAEKVIAGALAGVRYDAA